MDLIRKEDKMLTEAPYEVNTAVASLVKAAKASGMKLVVFNQERVASTQTSAEAVRKYGLKTPFIDAYLATYSGLPQHSRNAIDEGAELVLHLNSGDVGVRRRLSIPGELTTTTAT